MEWQDKLLVAALGVVGVVMVTLFVYALISHSRDEADRRECRRAGKIVVVTDDGREWHCAAPTPERP